MSVIATGGVVFSTPGVAHAAANLTGTVHSGQSWSQTVVIGPVLGPRTGSARVTSSTLAVDKASVLSGQSIVFTGRLSAAKSDTPLANHVVRLQESTSGEWKTIGSALAAPDGSVTFSVKPTTSAKYRLAYPGVRSLRASTSAEQAVAVKQPPPPPPPAPVRSSSSSGSTGNWAPAGVSAIGSNHQSGSGTAAAVVAAAAAQSGKPYVYAAAGPNAFDCSGLVQYVLAQFGISLPHNAHSQMGYGTAVSAADAAPGDLIFFLDGGYAYHVGIYAGGGQMYDAPSSGSTVGLHTIWSTNVAFRRIV